MYVHSRLQCLASLIDPVRLLYQTYYFLPFMTNKWRNTDEMWLVMGGGLAGSSNSIAVKVPLWLSLTRRVRVDTHWPGLRAVNTSVQHDACVHGPNSRVVCSDTRRRCSRLARLAVDGGVDVDGVTDLSQHCRYRANAVLRRHHRRDDTAQRLLHLALHAIHTHTQQCCRVSLAQADRPASASRRVSCGNAWRRRRAPPRSACTAGADRVVALHTASDCAGSRPAAQRR